MVATAKITTAIGTSTAPSKNTHHNNRRTEQEGGGKGGRKEERRKGGRKELERGMKGWGKDRKRGEGGRHNVCVYFTDDCGE